MALQDWIPVSTHGKDTFTPDSESSTNITTSITGNRFAALSPSEPVPDTVVLPTPPLRQSPFTFRVRKPNITAPRPRTGNVPNPRNARRAPLPHPLPCRILDSPSKAHHTRSTNPDSFNVAVTKPPDHVVSDTPTLAPPLPEPSPLILESPFMNSAPADSNTVAQIDPKKPSPHSLISHSVKTPTTVPSTPPKPHFISSLPRPNINLSPRSPLLSNKASEPVPPHGKSSGTEALKRKIWLITLRIPAKGDQLVDRAIQMRAGADAAMCKESRLGKETALDEGIGKKESGKGKESCHGVVMDKEERDGGEGEGERDSDGEWEFVG